MRLYKQALDDIRAAESEINQLESQLEVDISVIFENDTVIAIEENLNKVDEAYDLEDTIENRRKRAAIKQAKKEKLDQEKLE